MFKKILIVVSMIILSSINAKKFINTPQNIATSSAYAFGDANAWNGNALAANTAGSNTALQTNNLNGVIGAITVQGITQLNNLKL